MNVTIRRVSAVLAIAAAACLSYFAFLAFFIAGFHSVIVEHGVGRPMSSSESATYAAIAVGLSILAGGLGWFGIRSFRATKQSAPPN